MLSTSMVLSSFFYQGYHQLSLVKLLSMPPLTDNEEGGIHKTLSFILSFASSREGNSLSGNVNDSRRILARTFLPLNAYGSSTVAHLEACALGLSSSGNASDLRSILTRTFFITSNAYGSSAVPDLEQARVLLGVEAYLDIVECTSCRHSENNSSHHHTQSRLGPIHNCQHMHKC